MASITYTPELVISAGSVFPVVCTALVGARFYTRIAHAQSIGIDDWLTIPAVCLIIGYGAAMIEGAQDRALGYPAPPPTTPGGTHPTRIHTRQILFATNLMQVTQLALVKQSFLFFYRRVFVVAKRDIFDICCIVLSVIVGAWWCSFFFGYLFVCGTRFWAYWGVSQAIQRQNCVQSTILNNAYAISDVLTDVIIFILPLPMIWQLQMTTARKFAVTGVLALGALTIVASIMRMAIYIQSNAVLFSGRVDVSMLTTGGIYWSMCESGLGLIAATLPVLYKLFKIQGLQSIVASVREIVSLRSLSPGGSRRSPRAQAGSYPANTSQHSGVNIVESSVEGGSKNGDVESGDVQHELNQIHVTNTVRTETEEAPTKN